MFGKSAIQYFQNVRFACGRSGFQSGKTKVVKTGRDSSALKRSALGAVADTLSATAFNAER